MATVSFKQATMTMPTMPTMPETAVVKAVPMPPPEVASKFQGPQLEGEFSARDMRVPRFQLGAKSGKLTDEHPDWIGKFIFDQGHCLGTSVRVIFTRIRKFYEEDLDFDSEEIPRRYDKMAEAEKDGAQVRDVAELDLLVEVKSGAAFSELSVFEHDGMAYLPARYTVRSTAYGNTVGVLLKDWAAWMKGDLSAGFYTVTADKKSNAKNSWFVPVLKTDSAVPASLRGAIREKFGV